MPTSVQVNNITGTTPFDVHLCVSGSSTCYFISQITPLDLPYNFTVPFALDGQKSYCVKIIDYDGCIITNCFNVT